MLLPLSSVTGVCTMPWERVSAGPGTQRGSLHISPDKVRLFLIYHVWQFTFNLGLMYFMYDLHTASNFIEKSQYRAVIRIVFDFDLICLIFNTVCHDVESTEARR